MVCVDTLNRVGQNYAPIKVDLDQVRRITTNVLWNSIINMILKKVCYINIYKEEIVIEFIKQSRPNTHKD